MKIKYLWLLIASLAVVSATLLVDRFITPVPNWLATLLLLLSAAGLGVFLYLRRRKT